ncbi:hypothetical protein D9758_015706 [Tetrapyrgos nigripes]|uniref:ferric-chelate reductase (NADPH) n=1 Tax=Tetrapyrgos nigripes TaxID=182062 RepID=A0A8H5FIN9_9AGAR|nr:hypothetical protein D9758_015706 [Tetrapyrgos nigripes]
MSFTSDSAATQPSDAAPSITVTVASAPAKPLSALTIVYYTDLALIALFLFIVLLRLPRALARLWSISEFTNGQLLHHLHLRRSHRRRLARFNSELGVNHRDLSTDDSHVNYGSYQWHTQRIDDRENPAPPSYPPHVTSCVRPLRPVLRLLHRRVTPGVSAFHVCTMAVYLAALAFPSFYSTNVFTDPYRYGYIAVSQFPIVFGFAVKNGILTSLIGVGYEKVNFMHRFTGRVVFLAVNVHTLGYIYRWTNEGTFVKNIARPNIYWGLIATICVDLLFFFSVEFWRNKAYNFFLATHIISVILLFPSTYTHSKLSLPFLFASFVPWLADVVVFRTLKTRVTTATIRALPSLQLARIEIPSINAGWRGGQHVRLRIFSSALGRTSWVETHPFTIASVTKGEEGMILLAKKSGDWTGKLFELAKEGMRDEESKREGYEGVRVKVMVEGPYGGPGHRIFASFSAAVFVVGGSGISFALSAIQELIQKDLDGNSRVKFIQLVWSVQDPASLVPLIPLLTSMIQESIFTPLHISVFYTRAPVGVFPFKPDFFRSTKLTLSPGRPKISKIVEDAISRAAALRRTPSSRSRSRSQRRYGREKSLSRSGSKRTRYDDEEGAKDRGRLKGVVVGVCGPVGMADGVFDEVGKVDRVRRDQVGGVEVHEETFGW